MSALTLGFLVLVPVLDGNGNWTGQLNGLRWGEASDSAFPNDKFGNSGLVKDKIAELQAAGIDITIALGGYSGNEPGVYISNVAQLTAMYQSLVDTYGITRLDIDIEGTALNALPDGYNAKYTAQELAAMHHTRNLALKALKEANPGVEISYTIPVLPSGMLPSAVAMLTQVHEDGLDLDVVNLMAMDYGVSYTTGSDGGRVAVLEDQGRNAIDAASNTIAQLRQIGLDAKVGITPMLGINDVLHEVFTLEDAQQVLAYAKDNPDIASIGMWSLGRDEEGTLEKKTVGGSGIDQDVFDFVNIFKGLDDAGAGYNPASGVTVVGRMAGDDIVNATERTATSHVTVNHSAAAAGSTLRILRDGVLLKTVSATAGATATDVTLSGDDWGVDGAHVFTAQLVTGSTVGAASAGVHVMVDRVAPGAPTIPVQAGDDSLAPAEAAAGLNFTVNHDAAAAGTKLTVYRDGTALRTITLAAGSTQTTLLLSGTDWGVPTVARDSVFTAKLTDLAGNSSTVASHTVHVDQYATVAPWEAVDKYHGPGIYVSYEGFVYKSQYWTQTTQIPGKSGAWQYVGILNDVAAVPNAPQAVYAAGATNDAVFVSWDEAQVPGQGTVTAYDVYVDNSKVATVDTTYYNVSGLAANQNYAVAVVAVDEHGNSVHSQSLQVSTAAMVPLDIDQTYRPIVDLSLGYTDLSAFAAAAHVTDLTLYGMESIFQSSVGEPRYMWPGGGTVAGNDTLANGSVVRDEILSVMNNVNITLSIKAGEYQNADGWAASPTAYLQQILDYYHVDDLDVRFSNSVIQGDDYAYTSALLSTLDSNNNGNIHISYTLPVTLSGLTADGLKVLEAAHETGLHLDVINILVQGVGDPYTANQGREVVEIAKTVLQQLHDTDYDGTKLGIIVSTDRSDRFDMGDAHTLMAFAKENASIDSIGITSLDMDRTTIPYYGWSNVFGAL